MVFKMLISAQPRKGALLGHKVNTSARVSKYQFTKFADLAGALLGESLSPVMECENQDTAHLWNTSRGHAVSVELCTFSD